MLGQVRPRNLPSGQKGKMTRLYGPAVRCKRVVDLGSGLARMYPASDWSALLAPGHHGYQRAVDLINRQASKRAKRVTSFRSRREDRPPYLRLSRRPRWERRRPIYIATLLSLQPSLVGSFSCSTAPQAFSRPDRGSSRPTRAGAVKVGRRCERGTHCIASRPHLDGGEHGGTLKRVGRRHPSSP